MAAILLHAGELLAQTPDSATAAFERAVAAYQEGTREGRAAALRHWLHAAELYDRQQMPLEAARSRNNVGNVHLLLGRRDSARVYYRRAVEGYRASAARAREAQTLSNIGVSFAQDGLADSALSYYHDALRIHREEGDSSSEAAAMNNIAGVHLRADQMDSAIVYLSKALPLLREDSDARVEADILQNLGIAHHQLGRPDSALIFYRRALIRRREGGNPAEQAGILTNIGALHATTGRPDSALHYYERSLALSRTAGDSREEALLLGNIGMAYARLGRRIDAREYYERALRLHRTAADVAAEADILIHLSAQLREDGAPDTALAVLRNARSAFERLGSSSGTAAALHGIANVHAQLGRPDSALAYYSEALALHRRIGDPLAEATALANTGRMHLQRSHADSAMFYLRSALVLRRLIRDTEGEAATLEGIAEVHRLGADLGRAIAYYDSAAVIRASLARRTGSDQNRVAFGDQTYDLFSRWSSAWLAREGELGVDAVVAALAAAERGRGQALLDLMRGTVGAAPREIEPLNEDLPAEGAALIQEILRPGAASMSYLIDDDSISAWLVLPSGEIRAHRSAMEMHRLVAMVDTLRRAIGADASPGVGGRGALASLEPADLSRAVGIDLTRAWKRSAGQLGKVLFPAEWLADLEGLDELLIVPHRVLNLVPFTMLVLSGDSATLGEKVAVRYAPSLRAAAEAEQRAPGGAVPALVVSDPAMPEVSLSSASRVRLPQLPAAAREGATVAAMFATSALTDSTASEALVRDRIANAKVVHLATHGYAYSDERRTRESFVALAPDDAHDGLLTVAEILEELPPMNPDLVVLSACQTGLGNISRAEGTVGLQRAFLARGARSLLVSLWSVSDAATQLLMTSFYRHWRGPGDVGKAEALRRAQAEVRGTPGLEHPRYWAGFQLVGAR